MEDMGSDEVIDARKTALIDLVTEPNETFKYLYDFGDYWEHEIKVEHFLEKDNTLKYPVCIGGEMNCPPDDSGGIRNFYESMEILKDKKHPRYKEFATWFGRKYDREKFDREKANRQLKRLKKYIADWNS